MKTLVYGRNEKGAYVCNSDSSGRIYALSQLFLSGEIWGIDAISIEKKGLMERSGQNFGFFPHARIKNIFIQTLENYINFVMSEFKLSGPCKLIVGATNIRGYRITLPQDLRNRTGEEFGDEVVKDNIISTIIIDDPSMRPNEILKPFFKEIWDKCGLEMPNENS